MCFFRSHFFSIFTLDYFRVLILLLVYRENVPWPLRKVHVLRGVWCVMLGALFWASSRYRVSLYLTLKNEEVQNAIS